MLLRTEGTMSALLRKPVRECRKASQFLLLASGLVGATSTFGQATSTSESPEPQAVVFIQPVPTVALGFLSFVFGGIGSQYDALYLSAGAEVPTPWVPLVLESAFAAGRDVGASYDFLGGEDPDFLSISRPFGFVSASAGAKLAAFQRPIVGLFFVPKVIFAHGWQGTYYMKTTSQDGGKVTGTREQHIPAVRSDQLSVGLDFVPELRLDRFRFGLVVGLSMGVATNVPGPWRTQQLALDHAGPLWLPWGNIATHKPGHALGIVFDVNLTGLRLGYAF